MRAGAPPKLVQSSRNRPSPAFSLLETAALELLVLAGFLAPVLTAEIKSCTTARRLSQIEQADGTVLPAPRKPALFLTNPAVPPLHEPAVKLNDGKQKTKNNSHRVLRP